MASRLAASVGEVAASRGRFFFGMSIVILAVVLIGFSKTFYLRTAFDVPSIPLVAYVHGAVMTTWFVWLVVQTSLIRMGSFRRHRQLGVAGAFIGLGVVVTSLFVTLGVVPRLRSLGFDFASDISAFGPGVGHGTSIGAFLAVVVWGNFKLQLIFSVLLVSAILFRHQPETHKRLMLLASISVLGPALARISRWPGLGGELGPFVPTVWLLLLAALVAHDFRSRGKVHPATLFGGGFAVLIYVAGDVIGASEFGQRIALSIGT